jgi:spermidine/putrescine transport system permease protein
MIGNIIQDRFLIQNAYNEAAALAAVLMLAMLVLVTIYARALGTEDVVRSAAG